jgi:tRNA A-37 threonylcarbamoyl transferase component Bud32
LLNPGDQIDVWVVERALGSGGMGSVYQCRNKSAARISAAVKVLDSNLSRFPVAEARFIREAEILFRLEHPNIVKVRNIRTDADPPFLEMEFVEGESLEDQLARGAIPYERALPLMVQIAAALGYLHRCAIRHRDIKPANVLVQPDGRVKLVDFGLAMEADSSRLTQSGLAFGTVSYAPPEWLAPETLDPAKWDVYAAGVVFYETLTGRVAFPSSGVGNARQQAAQVIFSKQGHAPLDPGEGVPEAVRAVIRAATESDPSLRIATGEELFQRLEAAAPAIARSAPAPASYAVLSAGPDRGAARDTIDLSANASGAPTLPLPVRTGSGSRRGWVVGGAIAVAVLGSGAIATSLALRDAAPSLHPVVALVTGVPPGTPVAIRIDGKLPQSVNGFESTFSLHPGQAAIRWTVGPGCETGCPGPKCAPWCGTGSRTQAVDADTQVIEIAVDPPAPRDLVVGLPALPPGTPSSFLVGDRVGVVDGDQVRITGLLPGSYSFEAQIGTCPADARGCFPDRSCPDGCVSYVGNAIVPWGAGDWPLALALPAPSVAPAPAPSHVVAVDPVPAPVAAPKGAGRAGSLVTVGQFAKWLAGNADYQAEQVSLPGYLDGWTGAEPPTTLDRGANMTGITWSTARAYCSSHGGLAAVDAEPQKWEGAPSMEWRVGASGESMFRTPDMAATESKRKPSRLAGFRCMH